MTILFGDTDTDRPTDGYDRIGYPSDVMPLKKRVVSGMQLCSFATIGDGGGGGGRSIGQWLKEQHIARAEQKSKW